ncbi:hypothetical protein [Halorussus halophilus]|uniref:hypothetical protein n=1 Tax=Halorussus halophilus TaxID=2650975 RepID=UPI001301327B|nr:hypothetical protein [Halorussus halophilus]
MVAGETDPRDVRSIAVTADDVVTAYEADRRSARSPVLRVTPPFSGRMRARLHVADSESRRTSDVDEETGAVHVSPTRLVDETRIPDYPTPDDTEDAIRSNPDESFSVEHHHERQVEAVADWRATVADALVESVELRTVDGPHRVEVKRLG